MTTNYNAQNSAFANIQGHAFIPTVTLGDPNYDLCLEIVKRLVDAKAPALELRMPFSDPCADSISLQQASHRALAPTSCDQNGISTARCLQLIKGLRAYTDIPLMLSLYSNVAIAHGLNEFCKKASEAGINGVFFIDIPLSMVNPDSEHLNFRAACNNEGMDLILMVPDNAPEATQQRIMQESQGLVLLQKIFGGESLSRLLHSSGRKVVALSEGSSAEMQQLFTDGATAVSSGSAIAKLIAHHLDLGTPKKPNQVLLNEISTYVRSMTDAAAAAATSTATTTAAATSAS